MEDEQIIELYINRDERAIKETKDKYGSWIFNTALGVLGDSEMRRSARMKHIIRRGGGLRTGACVIYGHTL